MSYHLRGLGASSPWQTSTMANPTGDSWMGPIPYASTWYATGATADSIAAATGGKVVDSEGAFANNQPMYDIALPNGVRVNAGALASIATNPVWAGNQGIVDAESEKLLNSNACVTEWGNVVSDCTKTPSGTFDVQGGKVTYSAGVAPVPVQAPVLSQTQYTAWQAKNDAAQTAAAVTPTATPPVRGAPSVPVASPGAAAASHSSVNVSAGPSFGIPVWALVAAAAAAVFMFGGGDNGRR